MATFSNVPFIFGKKIVGESDKSYFWRESEFVLKEHERIRKNLRGRFPNAKTRNRDLECFIHTGNTNVDKRFVAVLSDTKDYSLRDFTVGQMEGARRVLKRNILEPQIVLMAPHKKYHQRVYEFTVGQCYMLLDYIQGMKEGEIQRDSVNFQNPLQKAVSSETFKQLDKELIQSNKPLNAIVKDKALAKDIQHLYLNENLNNDVKVNLVDLDEPSPIVVKHIPFCLTTFQYRELPPLQPLRANFDGDDVVQSIKTTFKTTIKQHLPCMRCSTGRCMVRRQALIEALEELKAEQEKDDEALGSVIDSCVVNALNKVEQVRESTLSEQGKYAKEIPFIEGVEGPIVIKKLSHVKSNDIIYDFGSFAEMQLQVKREKKMEKSQEKYYTKMEVPVCNYQNKQKKTWRRVSVPELKVLAELYSHFPNNRQGCKEVTLRQRTFTITIDLARKAIRERLGTNRFMYKKMSIEVAKPLKWHNEDLTVFARYLDYNKKQRLESKLLESISLTCAEISGKDETIFPPIYSHLTVRELKLVMSKLIEFKFGSIPKMIEQGDSMVDRLLGTTEKLDDLKKFSKDVVESNVNRAFNKLTPTLNKINKATDSILESKKNFEEEVIPQVLGQLKYATNEMTLSREMATHVANNMKEFVNDAHSMCNYAKDEVLPSFKKQADNISDTFDCIKHFFTTLYFVNLIMNISLFIKKPCFIYFFQAICSFCGVLKTDAYKWIMFLYDNCKEWFKSFMSENTNILTPQGCALAQQNYDVFKNYNENITEDTQSNVNNGVMSEQIDVKNICARNFDVIKMTLAFMATVIFGLLFGKLPKWSQIKTFVDEDMEKFSRDQNRTFKMREQGESIASGLRDISFAVRGFEALDKVYSYCLDKCERILNYFLGKECQEVLIEKELKEYHENIMKWISKVEEVDCEEFILEACSKQSKYDEICFLYDEGEDYLNHIINNKVSSNVSKIIFNTREKLSKVLKRFEQVKPGVGFREAPFVIYLYGQSGTCKSALMTQLNTDIRKYMKWPRFNLTYAMPTTDKYMSGYTGQKIANFDDLMQNRERAGQLLPELIPMMSNTEYSLDMAGLEDKGRKFNSKVIIITSNLYTFGHINNMANHGALARRINIMIEAKHERGDTAIDSRDMPYDNKFKHIKYIPMLLNSIEQGSNIDYKWTTQSDEHAICYEDLVELIKSEHKKFHAKQLEAYEDFIMNQGTQCMTRSVPKGLLINLDEKLEEQGDSDSVVREFVVNRDGKKFEFVYDIATIAQEDICDILILKEEFENMTNEEVDEWWKDYKNIPPKIVSKSKVFYEQSKNKINILFQKSYNKCAEFFKMYPLAKYLLSFFGASGAIFLALKGLMNLFNSNEVEDKDNGSFLKRNGKMYRLVEVKGKNKEFLIPESYSQNVNKPAISNRQIEAYSQNINKPTILNRQVESYSHNINKLSINQRVVEGEVKNNVSRKQRRQEQIMKKHFRDEQGAADDVALETVNNLLAPAQCIAGWCVRGTIFSLKAFFICGKIILLPQHFFRRLCEGDLFWIERNGVRREVIYDVSRMSRLGEKDACLYYVGSHFESSRSIINCFVKEQEMKRLTRNVPVVLLSSYKHNTLIKTGDATYTNELVEYQGTDYGAPVYKQFGWEYDIDTKTGECGALLIACSNILPQPQRIIGMHTAGFSNQRGGFSIAITQEAIKNGINDINSRCFAKYTGAYLEQGCEALQTPLPSEVDTKQETFDANVKIYPVGDFTILGTMAKGLTPSQPPKTNFIPTPFQGEYYPVQKKPAALKSFVKDGVKISPLINALQKYGKVTKPFQNKDVCAVSNSIQNELNNLRVEMDPEVTDLETAIFGIEGLKYCEKINMNSSPGWPYQCMEKEGKGKYYLFDVENKKIISEELLRRINEREEKGRKGLRVPSIWRDCMKDELRPLEKVEKGKTRLFTIAPLDFTILVRKYFLAFEQCFYRNHTKFFSAVGINAESYDWTESYNRLVSYGHECVAGDFGTFDGTLMSDLIMECAKIINNWYAFHGEKDEEAQRMRCILVDEMIHTCQLVDNCVYMTHQGNPSGNPLTVIINTIVNIFYMRLAWMEIMREKLPRIATMDKYLENVKEEAYGDDNRLVVKAKVLKYFNQLTISKCLAKHGIEYTDELKNSTFAASKKLEETSFLKRTYRQDPLLGTRIMLPTMDWTTITNLFNWTRKNLDMETQMQSNMRQALGFAFFHGREKYDEIRENFSHALLKCKWQPISCTYDEMFDIFEQDIKDGTKYFSAVNGIDFMTNENEIYN